VGILHDHSGQLQPLSQEHFDIYQRILQLGNGLFSFAHYDRFQTNIARGKPNEWHCRAGSRFLYICEDGLVHYCSQQRGYPGIPLEAYTTEHIKAEFSRRKPCAPLCTISCVHQTSMLDSFREQPRETLTQIVVRRKEQDPAFQPPPLVHALDWMFLRSSGRGLFGKAALRVLGVRRP
jgi:hypothetical protein